MLDHFKSRTAFEEFQCHRLIHLAMASLSLLNGSLAFEVIGQWLIGMSKGYTRQ